MRSPRRKSRSPARKSPRKSRSPVRRRSRSRSPVRIPLTKGSLGMYGYGNVIHTPATERRKALARALRDEDATAIFHKLNALMIMNKTRHPGTAAVFEADRNWVRDNYM